MRTIVPDVVKSMRDSAGAADYRERQGVIRMAIGQLGYSPDQLKNNIKVLLAKIKAECTEISEEVHKEVHEVILSSCSILREYNLFLLRGWSTNLKPTHLYVIYHARSLRSALLPRCKLCQSFRHRALYSTHSACSLLSRTDRSLSVLSIQALRNVRSIRSLIPLYTQNPPSPVLSINAQLVRFKLYLLDCSFPGLSFIGCFFILDSNSYFQASSLLSR
jgi:hypothetical protein